MTLNDLEPPKEWFLVNFSQFLAAVHILKVNCHEMPEDSLDQDTLRIKFSALNADCTRSRSFLLPVYFGYPVLGTLLFFFHAKFMHLSQSPLGLVSVSNLSSL